MSRHKYLLHSGAFLGLLLLVHTQGLGDIFGIPSVHAQNLSDTTITAMTVAFGTANVALSVLMWISFYFLRILLDPIIIFGGPVGGGGADTSLLNMLHEIWQLSRDIVNLLFALALIVGAVMTVVTSKTETVKTYLPKFVMAVVLVNFSWFIPRAVFDFSQVAAFTVYQLPNLISTGPCQVQSGVPGMPPKPCKAVTDVRFLERTRDADVTPAVAASGWKCPLPDIVCVQLVNMNAAGAVIDSQSRIINGLIINFARLDQLDSIPDPRLGGGFAAAGAGQKTTMIIGYLIKLIAIFFIKIALFFPMLAMCVAFFLRIPVLWLTMAFMPFAALSYVIGDKLGANGEMIKKIWSSFLGAAFMPAIVGVPLAVGFIMINAGSALAPPGILADMKGIPLFVGINDFWQLLWLFLAVAVLWKGVFDALKSTEYVAKFTEGIREQGKSLGQLAYRAPLSIPLIPVGAAKPDGTREKKSPLELGKTFNPRRLSQMFEYGRPDWKALGFDKDTSKPFEKAINEKGIAKKASLDIHVKTLMDESKTEEERTKALKDLKTELKDNGIKFESHQLDAVLTGLAQARGESPEQAKKLRENGKKFDK